MVFFVLARFVLVKYSRAFVERPSQGTFSLASRLTTVSLDMIVNYCINKKYCVNIKNEIQLLEKYKKICGSFIRRIRERGFNIYVGDQWLRLSWVGVKTIRLIFIHRGVMGPQNPFILPAIRNVQMRKGT